MKYYMELSKFDTFKLSDVYGIIGSIPASKKYIAAMVNNKMVHRIKKNLYTCINAATGSDIANRYQIASNITEDSWVSYHSAFEFYGFYNQVYFEVQVSSNKRFEDFDYFGETYKCYLSANNIQIDTIQGVRVTSIERTIVDSINMLGKVMDIEELNKCLELIHNVDENKIIEVLNCYNKEVLFRKVGYVLSLFKDDFRLSDSFFDYCVSKSNISNNGYLINNSKKELVYNSVWGLYVYPNMRETGKKGGLLDV